MKDWESPERPDSGIEVVFLDGTLGYFSSDFVYTGSASIAVCVCLSPYRPRVFSRPCEKKIRAPRGHRNGPWRPSSAASSRTWVSARGLEAGNAV